MFEIRETHAECVWPASMPEQEPHLLRNSSRFTRCVINERTVVRDIEG